MTFVETEKVEYKYNWMSESVVHVGHFLVKVPFGEGHGTEGMKEMLKKFQSDGARQVNLYMGGGENTEDFLKSFDSKFELYNVTVHSIGLSGGDTVHAEIEIRDRNS